jgi:hypothetical protein
MHKVPSPIPASDGNHQPCAGPSVADPVLSHSVVDGSAPWGLCSVKVVGERFLPAAAGGGRAVRRGGPMRTYLSRRSLIGKSVLTDVGSLPGVPALAQRPTSPAATPDTRTALMVFFRAVETRIGHRR